MLSAFIVLIILLLVILSLQLNDLTKHIIGLKYVIEREAKKIAEKKVG